MILLQSTGQRTEHPPREVLKASLSWKCRESQDDTKMPSRIPPHDETHIALRWQTTRSRSVHWRRPWRIQIIMNFSYSTISDLHTIFVVLVNN